jgi:hypothetical protein
MSTAVHTAGQALGPQNEDLDKNPEVSFFRNKYLRHTPFKIAPIQHDFTGTFNYGNRVTATIDRVGDLIGNIYLVVKVANLNNGEGGCYLHDDFGTALCEETALIFNTYTYDRFYPEKVHAESELYGNHELEDSNFTGKTKSILELVERGKFATTYYIRIPAWFSRNDTSQYYPAIAAVMTEMKLQFKVNQKQALIKPYGQAAYNPTDADARIMEAFIISEQVFLGPTERNYFSTASLRYIVPLSVSGGLQTVTTGTTTAKIDVIFALPVRDVIVLIRKSTHTNNGNLFNFEGTLSDGECFNEMNLRLNSTRYYDINNNEVPFLYKELMAKNYYDRIPTKNVYVMPFCLNPSQQKPTGNINFVSIADKKLELMWVGGVSENVDVLYFANVYNYIQFSKGYIKMEWATQ